MQRKASRHFSAVGALIVVATVAIGVAVLATVENLPHASSYWLPGISTLIPLVLSVASHVSRPTDANVNAESKRTLPGKLEKLREQSEAQWVKQFGSRLEIELTVPFSVTPRVSVVRMVDSGTGAAVRHAEIGVMDWNPGVDTQQLGDLSSIDAVVAYLCAADQPSRLVMLGRAGSGKSFLAMHLSRRLLEIQRQGGGHEGDAVPVYLSLATWDVSEAEPARAPALIKWATSQLTKTYPWLAEGMPGGNSFATDLIAKHKVLLVLDGLDEIPRERRKYVFKVLSDAAKMEIPMIVTCRPDEYADVAQKPDRIINTPVISIGPLPLNEIKGALSRLVDEHDEQGRALLDEVAMNPASALAIALSSPFGIWLMAKVYRDEDAITLGRMGDPDEILKYLLSRVVRAVYSDSGEQSQLANVAERRLRAIASYLKDNRDGQNIDWWRLQQKDLATRIFITGITGFLGATLLGTAIYFGLYDRFGAVVAIPGGIVLGLLTGILAGATVYPTSVSPKIVDLRFRWDAARFGVCFSVGVAIGVTFGFAVYHGGGAVAGLLSACIAGPICGIASGGVFGWRAGVLTAVNTLTVLGFASGIAGKNGHPLVSGLAVGVVYVISTWVFVGLFRPVDAQLAVSPALSLKRDRNGALVVGATAGVGCGILYGIADGPITAALVAVGMTVITTLTVSQWGGFSVARIWLAFASEFPPKIMYFLNDAYERELLRQVGASYQFRHDKLRIALLDLHGENQVDLESRGKNDSGRFGPRGASFPKPRSNPLRLPGLRWAPFVLSGAQESDRRSGPIRVRSSAEIANETAFTPNATETPDSTSSTPPRAGRG